MKYFWTFIGLTSGWLFYLGIQANAHTLDAHLPTSADYQLELEENDRANRRAQETLRDPDSTQEELNRAQDQLYGPNGNHA